MIDCETSVFSYVAVPVRAAFSGILMTAERVASPPKFPCASIVEADNYGYSKTRDLAGNENHSFLMYEVNVYSNLSSGKKTQCRSIMSMIDQKMQELGFVRIGCGPSEMPNADASVYRMVARYKAVIGVGGDIHKIT